ncbi:unnamed protein product [Nyctereutes procyonoides]|uniref:(raccoon dog) hypothetical protein n=1 Tax=Nyctereutes procyonoides TaxID=34880 RepID=A0A811YF48_NYCPR|nr:unnamed protein product [Nyctereutes procyonoides]
MPGSSPLCRHLQVMPIKIAILSMSKVTQNGLRVLAGLRWALHLFQLTNLKPTGVTSINGLKDIVTGCFVLEPNPDKHNSLRRSLCSFCLLFLPSFFWLGRGCSDLHNRATH